MFTQKWRDHWGLTEDPFACEDADKDLLLDQVDAAAVHSSFDRIFGNPTSPAPGIVFGEKGSGKSGLRRMMRRRLESHNQAHPKARMLLVEYIDFDLYMEQFRQAVGASKDSLAAAKEVMKRWGTSDHLDAILSLCVTELVDRGPADAARLRELPAKVRADALILTALYHHSNRATTGEALRRMGQLVGRRAAGPLARLWAPVLLSVVALLVALAPYLGLRERFEDLQPRWFLWAGLALLVLTWLWAGWSKLRVAWTAKRAMRSVRVLPQDARPLEEVLAGVRAKERAEFVLPKGHDAGSRYDLFGRLLDLAEHFGFAGAYVLVDRVDEPSFMSGSDERMKRFVQELVDIKLLQFPRLALKLFLPIEMEAIYRTAGSEDLKRMRLDKSNLVPELKWTGQELYEIANQRLRACLRSDSRDLTLRDLFADDVDFPYLRETLNALATPRYAFGFLSGAFLEHVRELPNDLPDDDPRWRLPRNHFDVVRAAWVDRAGVLRRSLN